MAGARIGSPDHARYGACVPTHFYEQRLLLQPAFPDEFDDGCGIGESVGVMFDAGLGNESDLATQGLVSRREYSRVFIPGYDFVGIAIDMEQGDVCLGEGFELINRA